MDVTINWTSDQHPHHCASLHGQLDHLDGCSQLYGIVYNSLLSSLQRFHHILILSSQRTLKSLIQLVLVNSVIETWYFVVLNNKANQIKSSFEIKSSVQSRKL